MAKRSKKTQSLRKHSSSPARDASRSRASSGFRYLATIFGIPFLLALVTFAAYWPSLKSGFVSDARLEIDEGFVTSLSNLPSIFSLKVLSMHLMLSDRPGEMLYLMLNSSLWGKHPFGFHLSSNLLHAANVALLFVLLGRLILAEGGGRSETLWCQVLGAAVATLIFALHPIAAESVTEISFSSTLLVTFFTLLALLVATFFRPDNSRIALIAGTAGVLCVFAAVIAKESGLAASALLIVYWFLFRRHEAKGTWLLFLGTAIIVTVTVLTAILHFAVSRQLKLDYLGGSFSQVFFIQPQLWVFMMGQLLWPSRLCADYVLTDMNLPSVPMAFAILVVVVLLQIWLAWRSRLGALGMATYWLGLATVSNFVPLYCILADRFYYLPLAGLAMQFAALLQMTIASRWGYWLAVASCLAVLLPFTFLTIVRQSVFANEFSLYQATLLLSPHSSLMSNSLALALFQQGRIDEAVAQYERTLEIDPKNSCAYISLGIIHLRQGELDAAIAQFHQALKVDPQDSDAHCSLGIALCQAGQMDEGMTELRQALAIDPANVAAHRNLGLALLQQGQVDPAIAQLRVVLDLNPGSTKARYDLGNALARQGKADEAIDQFQRGLETNPDDFEMLANLGVALAHKGLLDQAIARYDQALKLRPDSADVHDDKGVALIQQGQVAAAIAEFQEALRLNPDLSAAQTNLAKAMTLPSSGRN